MGIRENDIGRDAGDFLYFDGIVEEIFSAALGHSPRKNASIAENTSFGLSSHGKCAAPGTVTSRASGRVAAHSLPPPNGAFRSLVPSIVRTGIVTFARSA